MSTPPVPDTPKRPTIQEHSADAVGSEWTAADHEYLCRMVRERLEELAVLAKLAVSQHGK